MILEIPKAIKLTITMLAPAGVSKAYDATIPQKKQTMDRNAENMMTPRKLLNMRIDDNAGKMIRLEMSSAPHSFAATFKMI